MAPKGSRAKGAQDSHGAQEDAEKSKDPVASLTELFAISGTTVAGADQQSATAVLPTECV